MSRRRDSSVTVRTPDPSDPRSLDHPSHEGQWLALIDAIAIMTADQEYERLHGAKGDSECTGHGLPSTRATQTRNCKKNDPSTIK